MIHRHAGHRRHVGADRGGGVEPAAQADLQDRHLDPDLGERPHRHDREPLEEGQVEAGRRGDAGRGPVRLEQRLRLELDPADAEPLRQARQVRRRVERGAHAGRAQHRVDERRCRSLAVGAGHLGDGGKAGLWISQPLEAALHPVELEAHAEAARRVKPRQQDLVVAIAARRPGHLSWPRSARCVCRRTRPASAPAWP
jgi:hypothetical protein